MCIPSNNLKTDSVVQVASWKNVIDLAGEGRGCCCWEEVIEASGDSNTNTKDPDLLLFPLAVQPLMAKGQISSEYQTLEGGGKKGSNMSVVLPRNMILARFLMEETPKRSI